MGKALQIGQLLQSRRKSQMKKNDLLKTSDVVLSFSNQTFLLYIGKKAVSHGISIAVIEGISHFQPGQDLYQFSIRCTGLNL